MMERTLFDGGFTATSEDARGCTRAMTGRLMRLLALLLVAASAWANDSGVTGNTPAQAPWDVPLLSSLDDDPYMTDPAYNSGLFYRDDFGINITQANQSSAAKRVVRLSDGSLVVAALVKNPAGNQSNGRWNVGLVRYSANGSQRMAWSNPNPDHAHFNNEYVVYPKTPGINYQAIRDIKAIAGHIVVFIENRFNGGDDVDALVVVFGEDGRHKSTTSAFQTSSADFAGGLAVYSPALIGQLPHVVAVGGVQQGSGIQRPYFSRFEMNTDGTLTRRVGPKQLNTHFCDNTSRDCRPAGIALGWRGFNGAPAIYVINRYYHQASSDDSGWAMAVTKVDQNGDADSGWPGLWWYLRDPETPLPRSNWAMGIAVRTTGLGTPISPYRDQVYVLSEIKRRCGNGAAVIRFNHSYEPEAWQIVGGSSATNPMCAASGQPVDYPQDIAISGNRLAVVGYGGTLPLTLPGQPPAERRIDGWVAMANISGTGVALSELRDFTYPIGETRTHHSGLLGIVPVSDGRFVVTGDGRYPSSAAENLRGKQFMITAGIAPDRIFGNGFQP